MVIAPNDNFNDNFSIIGGKYNTNGTPNDLLHICSLNSKQSFQIKLDCTRKLVCDGNLHIVNKRVYMAQINRAPVIKWSKFMFYA